MDVVVRKSIEGTEVVFTVESGLEVLNALKRAPKSSGIFRLPIAEARGGAASPKTALAAVKRFGGPNWNKVKWQVLDEKGTSLLDELKKHKPSAKA